MEGYEEAGWVKLDEEQLKMIEESESEEEEDQTLHCQSCDKAFRSLNTLVFLSCIVNCLYVAKEGEEARKMLQ